MQNRDFIIVTNWDKVGKDDFYLSDKWGEHEGVSDLVEEARKLQAKDGLYEAFIVGGVSYLVYRQMDADRVFVNDNCEVLLRCESSVINSGDYSHCDPYEI